MTGSTTRANTYVRKYTADSVRSGVLLNIKNVPKVPKPAESLTATPSLNESMASTSTIHRKCLKARTKRWKKTSKTEASHSKKDTQTPVEDSKRMREFFDEVRQRQLKCYYHQMKMPQPFLRECTRSSRMCLKCGLQKRTKKDPSQNVYCTGAESMRQSLRESDRNKDMDPTWLWSSTAAYPHLLLKCAYDSGGFKDKWSLPLFMSQKLKEKENSRWYL